jgi:hypothetical protein
MPTLPPWEGPKYRDPGFSGIRMLVLGESHYETPGEEVPHYTQNVVRDWAQDKRLAFFTKIAVLALNKDSARALAAHERREFWDHVAFYNYIQTFVPKTRQRPTEQQWIEATPHFHEVLQDLQPEFILILGKELAARIPSIPKDIKTCAIHHPSYSGFKYEPWRSNFHNAVRAATSDA